MSKLIVFTLLLTVFQTIRGSALLCFTMNSGEMQAQLNETTQSDFSEGVDTTKFTTRKLLHRAKTDAKFQPCQYESYVTNCQFSFNLSNFVNKTTQPVPIDKLTLSMCFHCNNELAKSFKLFYFKAQGGACNIRFQGEQTGNYELIPELNLILI